MPDSFKVWLMEDEITERKVVVKVTSKGQRRRKVVCGKGKKFQDGKCVTISAKEKLSRKKGHKKAIRTKKAAGGGARRKANIKRLKAMKKRKGQGL